MLASLLPPSTRIRVILAPPLEAPSFLPQVDGIHTASTGLLSLVTLDVRFSSVLSYKPSRSFGHGFFSSLNARLAQRLSCARAQGVALLGGYSVYSEAVPESRLSLSLLFLFSVALSLSPSGPHLCTRRPCSSSSPALAPASPRSAFPSFALSRYCAVVRRSLVSLVRTGSTTHSGQGPYLICCT